MRAKLREELSTKPPLPAELDTKPEAEREDGAGKERKTAAWERELYKDVATTLDRIEDMVVKVCGLWNAAEVERRSVRADLRVKPHLSTVIVLIGAHCSFLL